MSVFKNWGEKEVVAWRAQQNIQRSYQEEVLNKLDVLESGFEVLEYGQLNYSTLDSRFSTYRLKALVYMAMKPVVFKERFGFVNFYAAIQARTI